MADQEEPTRDDARKLPSDLNEPEARDLTWQIADAMDTLVDVLTQRAELAAFTGAVDEIEARIRTRLQALEACVEDPNATVDDMHRAKAEAEQLAAMAKGFDVAVTRVLNTVIPGAAPRTGRRSRRGLARRSTRSPVAG